MQLLQRRPFLSRARDTGLHLHRGPHRRQVPLAAAQRLIGMYCHEAGNACWNTPRQLVAMAQLAAVAAAPCEHGAVVADGSRVLGTGLNGAGPRDVDSWRQSAARKAVACAQLPPVVGTCSAHQNEAWTSGVGP